LFFRRKQRLEGKVPDYYSYKLPETVRHKIIGTIFDYNFKFKPYSISSVFGEKDYNELDEFIILLERELGKDVFWEDIISSKRVQTFMFSCSIEEFLSALELLILLKTKNSLVQGYNYNYDYYLSNFIKTINSIFTVDKIGYEIVPVALDDLPFIIVPFNSKYLHVETIHKPRELMYNEDFKGALDEFERALDSYRKENYDDCIVKANKAFESTLKTILTKKGKTFDESKDGITQLVDKIKDIDLIDSRFQGIFTAFWQCLKQGASNIRNTASIAHGQGETIKKVQKRYADFVLRNTGTNICFLIEHYKEMK
jgi:tetratricopeptide (TPR) repeat protein